jgi:hypothetical protein
VRIDTRLHRIEPRIQACSQRVDAVAQSVDTVPETIDPGAEIEQASERRGGEQADRGPDRGVHLERERSIAP